MAFAAAPDSIGLTGPFHYCNYGNAFGHHQTSWFPLEYCSPERLLSNRREKEEENGRLASKQLLLAPWLEAVRNALIIRLTKATKHLVKQKCWIQMNSYTKPINKRDTNELSCLLKAQGSAYY